jgi:hypothetical protein
MYKGGWGWASLNTSPCQPTKSTKQPISAKRQETLNTKAFVMVMTFDRLSCLLELKDVPLAPTLTLTNFVHGNTTVLIHTILMLLELLPISVTSESPSFF